MKLTPVDYNPFEEANQNSSQVKLTPVNFNPFETQANKIEESIPEQIAIGLGAGITNRMEGMEQTAQKLNVQKAKAGERLNSAPGGGALGFSIDAANPIPTSDEKALTQLGEEMTLDEMTRESMKRRQEFRETPIGSSALGKVSEFAGEIIPDLALPGGPGKTIMQRAAGDAVVGGLVEGTSFTEDNTNLERGAGGAAGSGVFSSAAGNLGKLYRAFRGADQAEFSTELKKLSETHTVPITVGEMRNSPFFQRVETALERVPVLGIGGFREGQSKAITAAATRLTEAPGVNPDDIGRSIKMSLDRVSKANRKKSNLFYDNVDDAVIKAGNAPVAMTKTQAAARDLINKLSRNQDLAQESKLLQRVNLFAEAEPRSFEDARALRSDLLRERRQLEKAIDSNVDPRDISALKQLASAVDDDLTEFANNQGDEISRLFRKANEYWKTNVLPFQKGNLGRVMQSEFDTDQILATFIKNNQKLKPSANRARQLVDNLDIKGKKVVQHAILRQAFDTAMDESREIFSPQKFANELKRLSSANEVIFDKAQKNQLDGFVKLAEVAKRAGQFAENPPTGQRWVDIAVGGGTAVAGTQLMAGDPTGFALLGGVKGASLLLTTSRGRAVLTTINNSKKGSSKFVGGLRKANEEITRITSRIAAEYGADFSEAQNPGTESTETSQ